MSGHVLSVPQSQLWVSLSEVMNGSISNNRDVPTISRMRVSVDKAGVEYLLCKYSDQLVSSLEHKHVNISVTIDIKNSYNQYREISSHLSDLFSAA